MWDLIVSVPDYCLSFYFTVTKSCLCLKTVKDSFLKLHTNTNNH